MVDESRKIIREGCLPNQYKHGKYTNVPLTATQYLKLKKEFSNEIFSILPPLSSW